jgi:hypothetical protein
MESVSAPAAFELNHNRDRTSPFYADDANDVLYFDIHGADRRRLAARIMKILRNRPRPMGHPNSSHVFSA